MLAAHVIDRVAAAVGHDYMVPGAERGGRERLKPIGVVFGSAWGYYHGATWSDGLYSALKGFKDPVALLLLLLLPGLYFAQLAPVVSHHLFPSICQASVG